MRMLSRGRGEVPCLHCITYNLQLSAVNTAIGKICLTIYDYNLHFSSWILKYILALNMNKDSFIFLFNKMLQISIGRKNIHML